MLRWLQCGCHAFDERVNIKSEGAGCHGYTPSCCVKAEKQWDGSSEVLNVVSCLSETEQGLSFYGQQGPVGTSPPFPPHESV